MTQLSDLHCVCAVETSTCQISDVYPQQTVAVELRFLLKYADITSNQITTLTFDYNLLHDLAVALGVNTSRIVISQLRGALGCRCSPR